MVAHNLVDGNAAIISGANGEFHGYTNYVTSTCPTTLINLPRECKIEIFKDMKIDQLAMLCAAHPSFIDSCMHCFECYYKAEVELDFVLDFKKNDSEWLTFLLVLKYFGPDIQILSIRSRCYSYIIAKRGALLLKMISKYCSIKLKSITIDKFEINFTNCCPVWKSKILSFMVNVRELNNSYSKYINSAFLFERCATTIHRMEMMYTRMDKPTQMAFVQHYPNLSELHLFVTAYEMLPETTRTFLMLNGHVSTLTLGNEFGYGMLDGHRVEKLTVYAKPSLKLDRLPNVNCLIFAMYHDYDEIIFCWTKPTFLNGLKMSPNLHTIVFDAYFDTPFDFLSIILDIIFDFSNVQIVKFKKVYFRCDDVTRLPNIHRTIFKNIYVRMRTGINVPAPRQSFQINIVECRNRLMVRNINQFDQLFIESNDGQIYERL